MCELFLVKIDSGFDCLMSNMVVFSGFGLVGLLGMMFWVTF